MSKVFHAKFKTKSASPYGSERRGLRDVFMFIHFCKNASGHFLKLGFTTKIKVFQNTSKNLDWWLMGRLGGLRLKSVTTAKVGDPDICREVCDAKNASIDDCVQDTSKRG